MRRLSEPLFVALSSVVAAVGLTALKLVVGLATNSLGILSEAAHSGLDLVAAVVTFLAVRAAARPADADHQYGHGKIENLSALFETLLLVGTCGFIVYEGLRRLLGEHVPVDVNGWSFAVMAVSVVVDVSRSRALARVARRYNNQALEADALHFATDVWSSLVVVVGLAAVLVGRLSSRPELFWKADAIAALIVAVIATWVSLRLGRRTVDALLDRAPAGLHDKIVAAVSGVAGVASCERVRVRPSGGATFVDTIITVAEPGLEASHQVAHDVEVAVQRVVPLADVVVHVEPTASDESGVRQAVQRVTLRHGVEAHDVAAHSEADGLHVTMHVEVDPAMSLATASAVMTAIQEDVRSSVANVGRIDIHVEPRDAWVGTGRPATGRDAVLEERIREVAMSVESVLGCHDINVHTVDGATEVALHVTLDPSLSMERAHDVSHEVEERLRAAISGLRRVSVQAEAAGE